MFDDWRVRAEDRGPDLLADIELIVLGAVGLLLAFALPSLPGGTVILMGIAAAAVLLYGLYGLVRILRPETREGRRADPR